MYCHLCYVFHIILLLRGRICSIWLSTFRKDWSEEWPQAYLEKLLKDNPIINKVRKVVLDFRRLMKEKEGDKLAVWCDEVINVCGGVIEPPSAE